MLRIFVTGFFVLLAALFGKSADAGAVGGSFPSIDGGTLSIEDWRGGPVLVVNTASRCGFTPQYEALQKVYETYRDRGLVVLAVPSDDFRQELDSAEAVKEFCEVTYGLTLPMTDITHVRGAAAHPFFKAVKAQTGFEPAWNFNKILLSPEGEVVATYGSAAKPDSGRIIGDIEAQLR
ncbi:glutathione peroxidase [Lutimaribacter marinistellae]|uniref:Glutathione peroxidase n=1 Tax=Lutimaribacter marinistellae TaxID=1820329 RepID=A0ABV7TD47_9RHOB